MVTNVYDECRNIIQKSEPNTGTINFEYNAFGELIKKADNKGNLTEFYYDELGRMTSIVSPEGTTSYVYGCHYIGNVEEKMSDLNSDLEEQSNFGLNSDLSIDNQEYPHVYKGFCTQVLKKIVGYNKMEQDFIYDDKLRLIEKIEKIDNDYFRLQFKFNAKGQLTKVICPSGVEVYNIYDNYGNIIEKRDSNNKLITKLNETNGMGQPISITQGDGTLINFSYLNGFPLSIHAFNSTQRSEIINLKLNFNYSTGNLMQRIDLLTNHNQTENFNYDNLNRLISSQVIGQDIVHYAYDQSNTSNTYGNLASKTDIGVFSYNSLKINALKKVSSLPYSIVPPKEISVNNQEIEYSSFDKVVRISENSFVNDFAYTPQFERVKSVKSLDGKVFETKLYFENCEKLTNEQGEKWITYISGANGIAAIILSESNSQVKYFTYTDHLGSIISLTDENGNVIAEQSFDAWGRRRDPISWLPLKGNSNSGVDWLYRGYTGHEHIDEFALINMNNRLYDPLVGRMLSPDKVLSNPYNTQAYNKYSYAGNNPMCYVDPDGNLHWLVAPIIGAAVNLIVDLIIHDGKMNFGEIALSATMGGLNGYLSDASSAGKVVASCIVSHLNRFVPSIPIYQSESLNLSISPMIAFGSSGYTAGYFLNIAGRSRSLSYGLSVGYGFNSGVNDLGKNNLGEALYTNIGGYAGCFDGHSLYGFGLSSTSYDGNLSQKVGNITAFIGDFNLQINEDFFHGIGDNKDRFRTGGGLISYKLNNDITIMVGAGMLTGEMENLDNKDRTSTSYNAAGKKIVTYLSSKELYPNLRGGLFFAGCVYKGNAYLAGLNSEQILHKFQNFIHDILHYPHFADKSLYSRVFKFVGGLNGNYLIY
jgi:RHS repeat-associated protein